MITTASEHQVDKVEQMAGGKGHVIIEHLLGEKELDGKCGLYAKVTIEPNCTLGFHEHHGETETYYILSGEGSYNDGEVLSGQGRRRDLLSGRHRSCAG